MTEKSVPVYTRDATGLVRALGPMDVFVWTVVFFPWFSSWISNYWYTPSVVVNVNYYISIAIWFVFFCVFPPAVWWMLSAVMPRTGGDYVFASRALHPSLGFAASFGVTFALALSSIGAAPLFGLAQAATQLETVGQITSNPAITSAGNFIDPFGASIKVVIFAIGLVILALGAAFAFFGSGLYNKVMWGIFIVGLIGVIIELPILATTTRAAFEAAYATYYPGGVQAVYAAAQKAGYTPGLSLNASIAAVPLLLINLGPYLFMYNVAGEVRDAKKSYLWGAWGAIFLSAAFFLAFTLLTDQVMGIGFVEAWTMANGGYAPVISALVAVMVPNLAVNVVLALILLVSNVGFGFLGFVFVSRPMFAWAFDRILPAKLASVHDRYHSPGVAILVTLLISYIGWTLYIYGHGFTSVILNSLLIKFVAWAIVSLAAVAIPFRRKDIFESSPVKYRLAGVPVLSILGAISFLTFAGYVVNSVTTNVFYTPTGYQAGFLIFLFGATIVYYFIVAAYRKTQGIDISKAFAQLPPD
ncbi:MAG TPA: amino acid permease [Terriglobales bacterium]|nr:amino acid permease [Terriglobales bacterium]